MPIRIKRPTMHRIKFDNLVDAHHKMLLQTYQRRKGLSKSASKFLTLQISEQKKFAKRDMISFLRNTLKKVKKYAKDYGPEVGAKIYSTFVCEEYQRIFGVSPDQNLKKAIYEYLRSSLAGKKKF